MLRQFGSEIWISDGPGVSVLGFHYPTRMAVIRLADGTLFLWSPIEMTQTLQREIDQLGRVAHIVAPNSLHHLALGDWQAAYPKACVYAPPKLRSKRTDLKFDEDLSDTAVSAWAGEIEQVVVRGNLITSEVVFFHRPSGTVLFTDLIQQFSDDWFTGWRRHVARADRMVGDEPSVPRKFRMGFVNRAAARQSLAVILEWPVQMVLLAHGAPVTEDAPAFLRRAFRWLCG